MYLGGWRGSELLDVEKEKRFEKEKADSVLFSIG